MPEPRAIVPDKGIRPGRNSTGVDIAKGVFVALVAAGTEDPAQIALPAAGGKIYGVTMAAIKNGQIGDVQVEGRARILAGASGIAHGADVATTVAGAAVTAVSGNIIVGICAAAAASGSIGEVELSAPVQTRIVP